MKKLIQNYLNKTLHWEYESSNKAVNYYWGISSDVLYGVRIEDLNVYTNHDVHILLQDCAYLDKRSLWKRVSEKNIIELKNIKEIENGSYL